jgi:hypothetical protein
MPYDWSQMPVNFWCGDGVFSSLVSCSSSAHSPHILIFPAYHDISQQQSSLYNADPFSMGCIYVIGFYEQRAG